MEITRKYMDIYADKKETAKQRKQRSFESELEYLSKQLELKKEEIYRQKLESIDNEILSILENTHDEFLVENDRLLQEKLKRINDAELYKNFQTECITKQYEADIKLATETCENQKNSVQEKMMALLEEKKKRIMDDRDNIDALEPTRALPTKKASRLKEKEDRSNSKADDYRREKGSAPEADNDADLAIIRSILGTPINHNSTHINGAGSSRGRGGKRK